MMKGIFWVVIFVLFSMVSLGQGSGNYQGRLEASWTPGAYIATKPKEVGETKGTEFLNQQWFMGDIDLYKGEIKGYPLKFSLLHNRMEINTREGIKLLYARDIEKFAWFNLDDQKEHVFVNAGNFKDGETPLIGILEQLYDGNPGLYKRYFIKIKTGNYVPTHGVGQAEDEYIIDEVRYLSFDNILTEVTTKKQFLSAFSEQGDEVKRYMKDSKLSFKDDQDLIQVLDNFTKDN